MKNNYSKLHEKIKDRIKKSESVVSKEFSNYKKDCVKGFELIKNDLILIKEELNKIKPEAIIEIGDSKDFYSTGIRAFKMSYILDEEYNDISIRVGTGLPYDDGFVSRSCDGKSYLNFEHEKIYFNEIIKKNKIFLKKVSENLFNTFLQTNKVFKFIKPRF
jgi:hypothetical protein